MAYFRDRVYRPCRCRVFKCLTDFPRTPHLFHLPLKITPCHVQGYAITKHTIQRVADINILTTGFQCNQQLYLVMYVAAGLG